MLNKFKQTIFIFLVFTLSGFPHEEKHHNISNPSKNEKVLQEAALYSINSDYLKRVRPIFEKKCFDCHSSQTQYPWYHMLPGIKQLIDADIKEGGKHLQMDGDFPFKGHGAPIEDLSAIQKTIEKEEMPPLLYRLMHRDSKPTEQEKSIILDWVNKSLENFKKITSK